MLGASLDIGSSSFVASQLGAIPGVKKVASRGHWIEPNDGTTSTPLVQALGSTASPLSGQSDNGNGAVELARL
jgi:hypothetical protein